MSPRPVAGTAVLAIAAVTALAGCGHGAAAARRSDQGSSHLAVSSSMGTAGALPAAGVQQPVLLRRNLEMLLGHHALLLMDWTRSRLRHDPAAAQRAAGQAVDRNSGDIAAAVGSVYGTAAGRAVRQQWDAHIRAVVAYADATTRRDPEGQQAARAQLRRFERDLGEVLTSAIRSKGVIAAVGGPASSAARFFATSAAAQAALQMHVNALLAQIDAYHAGDRARSYALEREAFGHMIGFADTLATGIVASAGPVPRDFTAPRRQLQTALGRVLGEHMWIMINTMRTESTDSADFRASGATLNANTAGLSGAISALYGRPSGQRFLQLWATHVDGLTAYTAAAASQNQAGQAAAKARLDRFAVGLATFLATATEQRLPAVQLAAAITMHDRDLLTQLDAYAARDYGAAEDIAYVGYQHMFDLAQQLAEAIGDTVAGRLPLGGAATGGGGTARGASGNHAAGR